MKAISWRSTILVGAAAIFLNGCQTTGGSQETIAGVGIGAALGCAAGALIQGGAKGCAVGAAAGAAVGWAAISIKNHQSKQVNSGAAERRVYGVSKSVSSPQVNIREGVSSPRTVRAGQSVDVQTRYSVFLPPSDSSVRVTETWTVKKDGKTLGSIPTTVTRSEGGYSTAAEIPIPQDAPAGNYVIEHRVKAGSSYDVEISQFVVKA